MLCYITDRHQFPGDEPTRRQALLAKVEEAAQCGVDYIQLREKDLSGRDLESLAREAVEIVHRSRSQAKSHRPRSNLLINSRLDIALATGAQGIHLPADDISLAEVRKIWASASANAASIISVSCHSIADVEKAELQRADIALFAPVFEKQGVRPSGLETLFRACQNKIPVLALGGVSFDNARRHSAFSAERYLGRRRKTEGALDDSRRYAAGLIGYAA
jgi:thiamine-phosphate pyrophosphorylase